MSNSTVLNTTLWSDVLLSRPRLTIPARAHSVNGKTLNSAAYFVVSASLALHSDPECWHRSCSSWHLSPSSRTISPSGGHEGTRRDPGSGCRSSGRHTCSAAISTSTTRTSGKGDAPRRTKRNSPCVCVCVSVFWIYFAKKSILNID